MIQNVVIADDSSTARMIIRRCLEIAGCMDANFIEVADGEQALKVVKESEVDLLVTDLNMPNMDGRTLLKHVKASPRLTNLPIVVVSSASNEAVRDELMSQGALAVVDNLFHLPVWLRRSKN
ncbi:MAG: response regulator [Calditrichaeota bacterium]|nr:response regulator [Calditrichota bacterium]